MDRPKRSAEFQHYCKTLTCPQGHRGTLRFLEGEGEIITNLQLRDRMLLDHPTAAIERASRSVGVLGKLMSLNHELAGAVTIRQFREDSALECIQCNMRWPVFLDEDTTFDIIGEHARRRFEVALGTDTRFAAGHQSVVDHTLTLTFERHWSQRIEFLWEEMTAYGIGGETKVEIPLPIGGNFLARLEPKFERTIKSRLFIREKTERVSHATIDVLVPAGSRAKILLHWKEIWQEVVYDIRLVSTGQVLQIPFRSVEDVVCDHEISHV
jgi:hypothetical protein